MSEVPSRPPPRGTGLTRSPHGLQLEKRYALEGYRFLSGGSAAGYVTLAIGVAALRARLAGGNAQEAALASGEEQARRDREASEARAVELANAQARLASDTAAPEAARKDVQPLAGTADGLQDQLQALDQEAQEVSPACA